MAQGLCPQLFLIPRKSSAIAARAREFSCGAAQGSVASHEATLTIALEALGTAWLVVNFSFFSSSAFAVPLMAPTTQIAAKYLFNIAYT